MDKLHDENKKIKKNKEAIRKPNASIVCFFFEEETYSTQINCNRI